jgi:hypothetical protein
MFILAAEVSGPLTFTVTHTLNLPSKVYGITSTLISADVLFKAYILAGSMNDGSPGFYHAIVVPESDFGGASESFGTETSTTITFLSGDSFLIYFIFGSPDATFPTLAAATASVQTAMGEWLNKVISECNFLLDDLSLLP